MVSALAIHNLGAGQQIRPVYSAIHGLLSPGGWFINLDLVLDVMLAAAEAPLAQLYARAGKPTMTTRDHDHGVIDTAPSLEDHLDWLHEAGFDSVDCVRKHLSEVFFAARRPT